MSRIDDQVFDRLMAGEPPGDIRKSVSSASRFADGISSKVKSLDSNGLFDSHFVVVRVIFR
jgi:hypothetical protein